MDTPVENGHLSFFGSIFLAIISWFTPENVDLGLKVITGVGALITGALAARYYWYAGKEKKESWKNRKKDEYLPPSVPTDNEDPIEIGEK